MLQFGRYLGGHDDDDDDDIWNTTGALTSSGETARRHPSRTGEQGKKKAMGRGPEWIACHTTPHPHNPISSCVRRAATIDCPRKPPSGSPRNRPHCCISHSVDDPCLGQPAADSAVPAVTLGMPQGVAPPQVLAKSRPNIEISPLDSHGALPLTLESERVSVESEASAPPASASPHCTLGAHGDVYCNGAADRYSGMFAGTGGQSETDHRHGRRTDS